MEAIVWSRDNCAFCERAKMLLTQKNISFEERKIGHGWNREDLLEVVPTAKSVPQIFIDNEYVGGFEELRKKLS
jgi:glutaredoxin